MSGLAPSLGAMSEAAASPAVPLACRQGLALEQPPARKQCPRDTVPSPHRCPRRFSDVSSRSSLRVTSRRDVESRGSGLESSEARQKFAGAKAISSDMFFGREVDTEVRGPERGLGAGSEWARSGRLGLGVRSQPTSSPQYEARSRLQQLSGSSAISSSDLFGDLDSAHGAGRARGCRALWGQGRLLQARSPRCALTGSVSLGHVLPAADIAQFKQGVKSVAGKMAVLANGVMNSLQVCGRVGGSAGRPAAGVSHCRPNFAPPPGSLWLLLTTARGGSTSAVLREGASARAPGLTCPPAPPSCCFLVLPHLLWVPAQGRGKGEALGS